MKIGVHESHAAGRCAFCHGDLDLERAECSKCHSAYHPECTERCVSLGCQGALAAVRYEPAPGPRESDLSLVLGVFLVLGAIACPILLAVAYAVPSARPTANTLNGILTVLFVIGLYAQSRERPAERKLMRVSSEPKPAPKAPGDGLALPDMFQVRPIQVADGSAHSLEERQHQREALGDRRPPGLGRTL
jgi:hypothetical protein